MRQSLNPATQTTRFGCESIIELEYQESFVWNGTDLTEWNVVEGVAGNVSVSGGVMSIISNVNSWGANGVWRRAGGVPGYISYAVELTAQSATAFLGGLFTGSALPSGVNNNNYTLYIQQGGRTHLRNVSVDQLLLINFQQPNTPNGVKLVWVNDTARLGFIDGQLRGCGALSTSPLPAADPLTYLTCGRTDVTVKISNYREHFGGFNTSGPTVDYVADAGIGKLWENFDLSNLNFDYGLSSPNATFRYYYGNDATPTWSAELTLAQLNAVGNLADHYRYAMIRAIQNSDGDTQCPVTEVNALDATEGQHCSGGGGGGTAGGGRSACSIFI